MKEKCVTKHYKKDMIEYFYLLINEIEIKEIFITFSCCMIQILCHMGQLIKNRIVGNHFAILIQKTVLIIDLSLVKVAFLMMQE